MAGSSVSPVVDSGAAAPTETGRYAILEQLLADGIHYMFGNPGTVEQGFLDALGSYPDLQYILTLQETIAVAIADGYARARHRPAVVQLHSGVGLGNGIGMLYQAKRGGSPLVVIAGESGVRYDAMDAQMAADLVSIAKPVTKWATRVVDPGSVLRVLRRAIKIAGTPPTGPVFVALPADVLDAPQRGADRRRRRSRRRGPSRSAARRRRPPTLLARRQPTDHHHGRRGRDVRRPGRADPGRRAARRGRLGRQLVRGQHRRRPTRSSAASSATCSATTARRWSRPADAVLIVGTYVFPEVFPTLTTVFAPGARVVHIDLDAYEIAKNFPVDLGLVGDPKLTLAALADALGAAADRGRRARQPAGGSTVAAQSASRPRPRCATPTSRRAARSRSTPRDSWRSWRPGCPTTRSSSTRR